MGLEKPGFKPEPVWDAGEGGFARYAAMSASMSIFCFLSSMPTELIIYFFLYPTDIVNCVSSEF